MSDDSIQPARDHPGAPADSARAALVAQRRALLTVQPGTVRDLDAAANCGCSCHPQPGRNIHPNGICPCQLGPGERRHLLDQLLEVSLAEPDLISAAEEQEIADAAAALHMKADVQSTWAPWVITGAVDGHAFHLRERSQIYVLRLATEPDRPDEDVADGTEIKAGLIGDLSGEDGPDNTIALRLIAASIRTHLRQATCAHRHAPDDRYCPACGTPLVDPAQP